MANHYDDDEDDELEFDLTEEDGEFIDEEELEAPTDLDLELAGELDSLGGCCTVCGCTEQTPCHGGCFWANSAMTLCSRCATTK